MNRRNFLKLGSLFVPVVAAPTVAYSFCGGWKLTQPITFGIDFGSAESSSFYTISDRNGRILASGRIIGGRYTYNEADLVVTPPALTSGVVTLSAKFTGKMN